MKRVAKEADSAWLRFGPDLDRLDAGSEPAAVLAKSVLLWQQIDCTALQIASTARLLGAYHGFIALDAAAGDATAQTTKNALRSWREALYSSAVDRT
jgi:hypothetical protein